MLKQRFAGVRKSCRSEEVLHLGRMATRDSAQGRGIRGSKEASTAVQNEQGRHAARVLEDGQCSMRASSAVKTRATSRHERIASDFSFKWIMQGNKDLNYLDLFEDCFYWSF